MPKFHAAQIGLPNGKTLSAVRDTREAVADWVTRTLLENRADAVAPGRLTVVADAVEAPNLPEAMRRVAAGGLHRRPS
jgi:hypothetical protein